MTARKVGKKPAPPAIQWTARALSDLREIDAYIARDNPVAAERWVAKLVAKAEAAARRPHVGRIVPERARADVREVFVRTYRIVYRVRERGIVALTVFEGRRLFPRGAIDPSHE
jgi:toxin ParE1/3/4